MNSNSPFDNDLPETSEQFDIEAAEDFRRKAGAALLITLGLGLAAAALVHVFRPEPKPRQRIARLIEDMENGLRDAGAPMMHKAGELATGGAHALSNGFCRSEAQLEKFLRGASRQLRRLASSF